ncbi:MAG: peptide deformylase [Candidatus Omnitrophica bacterium]|nr:peptide deformylase [Candidatus Omnitrophota bacterium]
MAKLKIKYYPDPVLQKKSEPLTDFGSAMQKFFDDMIETMYVEDGVGLAAPQVGVSKRILIACPTVKEGEEYVIVNPEISEERGREMGSEGCLSLPGISGQVPRAKKIRLQFQDREGKPHNVEIKDFFARIIQHEVDHLNGILLIDRVDFDKRQQLLADYRRL